MSRWTVILLCAVIALIGLGCAKRAARLNDQAAAYQASIDALAEQGCEQRAPRELARAIVHLEAARDEISERDYDAALDHLVEVEYNIKRANYYLEGPAEGEKVSDLDQDGIPDALDLCPTLPETVNGHMDDDGCPDLAY